MVTLSRVRPYFPHLDKFTVTVDPAKYEASAKAGAAEVLTAAMRWIHEPETRPRRRR